MADRKSNRSGVALIVVLGLVAILMIVSVAFTIQMRVERAGAANLRHAAVARQIVKGGLAAALMTIDKNVGDDAVPQWFDPDVVTALTYKVDYRNSRGWTTTNLWQGTIVSYPTNASAQHVGASLLTVEAEPYFPAGLAYRGYASKYIQGGSRTGGRGILQPEWIPVFSDEKNANVMGRYAFFALDVTGLLDASCMTNGATARWMGRDPGEMAVSSDLFPNEVTDTRRFSEKNRDAGTYETLAEFQGLNSHVSNNRSFTTFSYDPGPTNDLIYIGGDAESIRQNKARIIEAFYDCGLTAGKSFGAKDCEQARWAYLGLVDYVDNDHEMEDDDKVHPWQRPATESMPLMSGFLARLTIEAQHKVTEDDEGLSQEDNDVKMRLQAEFTVPFVCPFLDAAPNGTFKLEGKARLGAAQCAPPYNGLIEESPAEPKTSLSQGLYDNIVTGLRVNAGDGGIWVTLPLGGGDNEAKRTRLQEILSLNGLEVMLQAAGATYMNGNEHFQHRYPLNESKYDDDDESWLTTCFNASRENVRFDRDRPTSTSTSEDGRTTTKTWSTNVVVWAEIFDPRFSCIALGERNNDTWDEPLQWAYYKSSHRGDSEEGYLGAAATKLRTLNGFGGFSAPARMVALGGRGFDHDADGRSDPFGGYFCDDGTRISGASPLTAYVLSHPDVLRSYFGMPMDGFQRLSDASSDDSLLQVRMHVKNAPLESVGELGYLPIGVWQTIRLYNYSDDFGTPDSNKMPEELYRFSKLPRDRDGGGYFHPVLDRFSVVRDVTKGRVNINTLNKNVLATVFHLMPVGTEEGSHISPGAESGRIDGRTGHREDSLRLLAEAVIDYRNDRGPFERLSQLGYLFDYGDDVFLNGEDKSFPAAAAANAAGGDRLFGEFEREAIIRNSCGLFTTRGQTFIVVVRGESYSPPFGRKTSISGGTSNASKTIIAQVWRDSVPDEDDNHPMYVQFFKIIDD